MKRSLSLSSIERSSKLKGEEGSYGQQMLPNDTLLSTTSVVTDTYSQNDYRTPRACAERY